MAELAERLATLSPEKRALLALRLARGRQRTDSAASDVPQIAPDAERRHEPFPLTALQQAYWIGRSGVFAIGDVANHVYLELDAGDLDLDRLSQAWRRLVERHDALRLVLLEDGRQQVLERVPPYSIAVEDLRNGPPAEAEARLAEIRAELSHQVLPSDRWPLFELRAAIRNPQSAIRKPQAAIVRLYLSLDGLILDAWSIALLLDEWALLYEDPAADLPPLSVSFRDYVLAERALEESEQFQAAREYWQKRLPSLPPAPDLPLVRDPASVKRPTFVRRRERLAPEVWQQLKDRAVQAGLTPTGMLLAAYADVLALWSSSPRFTLSVPRLNRLPLHPDVNDLAGEFASFTLLEVDHAAGPPSPSGGGEGGGVSFVERARRVQHQLWEDLNQAAFSGVHVVRALAQAGGTAGGVMMPVVFTSLASSPRCDADRARRVLGEQVFAVNQSSQVWLDNHVAERDGGLDCDWDSVDELLPPGLSESMLAAFFRHLHRLAASEDAWHAGWPETASLLLPPDQAARRAAVNSTEAPLVELLVQDLFTDQARLRPEQTAVVAVDRSLTYGELDRLANRWARRLRAAGVGPNRLVAVVMEKGWEQVVGALAIVRAGGAYLPVDARLPRERLWHLLEQGEAEIVLTQTCVDKSLDWPESVRRFRVSNDEEVATFSDDSLEAAQTPDDLLYCLFTSGSTGVPKGVMIEQRGVVNCLLETNRRFGIGPDDRVLALTALHHDLSVFDLFGVLAAGGTLVLPDPEALRDPAHWAELLHRERVTLWNSVPAMMAMLLEWADGRERPLPDSLRLAFLGGDWIPVTLPDRLAALVPAARVVSVGGPTETTLWNIWYPVEQVDPAWRSIPYGRPIVNTRYFVTDESLAERPEWVPGEICCAGVGVARGYWRDPEMTARKFVLHPRTGERIYRTGDLGRWLPDGTIEFLGRLDFQVKIQGYRIELGEIEATLQQHPAVRAAVAAVVGEGGARTETTRRLVAYVVPSEPPGPAAEELQRYLQEKLPAQLVPSAFMTLDRLPLTANGKVDRRGLPAPQEETGRSAPAPAGSGETTAEIARIVAAALRIEAVEPDANLVSLGADSIDMIRIGNQLDQRFGFRPRIDQLFRLQTVAALASFYDAQLKQTAAPTPLGSGSELAQLIASFRLLHDPAEREAFKKSQPGIRRSDTDRPSVALIAPEPGEALLNRYRERRSHRAFSLRPVPLDQFSHLLAGLYLIPLDGQPKYLYPSPGGLYPTQVYLHVKAARVESVPGGTYYYHPVEHRLVSLAPGAEIDRDIHIPHINTPIFDEAAFSVFLVCQLSAIAPSYSDRSLHFATLEAGLIAGLLESRARECGIGLCQIGSIEFERIRHLFQLEPSHVLIHSLLGGLRASEDDGVKPPGAVDAGRAAALLQRIKHLSPDEVRALLAANRPAGERQAG